MSERGIGFLDGADFRVEVAVFAGLVRAFDVDKDEVIRRQRIHRRFELGRHVRQTFDLFHADELGKAFVHRINRDGRGLQGVALLERRDGRLMGDAAQQEAIGRFAVLQHLQRQLVKLRHDFRHLGRAFRFRNG